MKVAGPEKNPISEKAENKMIFLNSFDKIAGCYISEFAGEHEDIELDNNIEWQTLFEEPDEINLNIDQDSYLLLSDAASVTTENGRKLLARPADKFLLITS
ncbi:hypothetical protein GcM3_059031 [Golovinomyces cichoracearum]|uniref:Uncharacterized protein n=1 Tax=Golovinomyces cichoracearum TaxID=62708 RepID=A0A420IWZ5_9PEZI|nr:hypothetical protein GcM3_059031 [Golovinomyces cichoracearum]